MPVLAKIDTIKLDPRLQARTDTDKGVIAEYAAILAGGGSLPALTCYQLPDGVFVVDGWHRLAAHKIAGSKKVAIEVQNGTFEDALRAALQANTKHGKRLTNADKRRAIQLAIGQWPSYTDRRIAELTGTTHPTVATVRAALERGEVDEPEVENSSTVAPVVELPADADQPGWVHAIDSAAVASVVLADPRLTEHAALVLGPHRSVLERVARIKSTKEIREYLMKLPYWVDDHNPGHRGALIRRLGELATDGGDAGVDVAALVDPQVALTWSRRRALAPEERWRCLLVSILAGRGRSCRSEHELRVLVSRAQALGLVALVELLRKKIAAIEAERPASTSTGPKTISVYQIRADMVEKPAAEILASSDVLGLALMLSEPLPPCEPEALVARLQELGAEIVRCPAPPCQNRPYSPQKGQVYYTRTCPKCHKEASDAAQWWRASVSEAQQILAWQVSRLAPSAVGGELWVIDADGNPVQVLGLRIAQPWELGDLVPELRRAPATPAAPAPTVAERFRAQSVRVGAVWVRRGAASVRRARVYVSRWSDEYRTHTLSRELRRAA